MIKNWHSKLDTTYPNFQTQLSFMNVYIEATQPMESYAGVVYHSSSLVWNLKHRW